MLLVSFHQSTNNIYGYDETNPGSQPLKDLLEISTSDLSELRGMLLANGFLYVVNGGKGVSNVLCCVPDPKKQYYYTQQSVFVPKSSAVSHPFDIAFETAPSPQGGQTWYVSDQDSNVVAAFTSQSPFDSTSAASVSAYLEALLLALQNAGSTIAGAGFLAATFIPTSKLGAEIPKQTTVDPSWGGLTSSFDKSGKKVANSVRGVAVFNSVLYVADEAGNAVRMYDPLLGTPWGSTTVKGPVHLLIQNGTLYVTTDHTVLAGTCVSAPETSPPLPSLDQFSGVPAPPPYPPPPAGYTDSVTLTLTDLGLNLPSGSDPSGLTFDGSGNLYVALRKTSEIYGFQPNSDSSGPPFVPVTGNPIFTGLPDEPEFLLWVENVTN